ncbi:MAG TPA: DUF5318 family protein [Acidimicrobiales bacterium]|nr:DUF5318 family protein [Acidimicrobiales bacterium]
MRTGSQSSPGAGLPTGLAQVEYRLQRDSAVREYQRGRLSRLDICDAQPELMRVAQNLGRATDVACPICEDTTLVHVSFAFGPRLPPSGRPLASNAELQTMARTKDEVAFYIVEVCTSCRWNHLLRMFNAQVARRRPRPARG